MAFAVRATGAKAAIARQENAFQGIQKDNIELYDENGNARTEKLTLGGISRHQEAVERAKKSTLTLMEYEKSKGQLVVESREFELFLAAVAILNAIQIGMSTDLKDGAWVIAWQVSEHLFTAIFFFEMCLKLVVLKWSYFEDRWNLMDFGLASLAVVDNWILSLAVQGDNALSRLTLLRILRLARFARVFRMVRYLHELVSLLEALAYSVKTMGWAYILLFLLIYMYSLVCVEFIGNSEQYPARSEDEFDLLAVSENFNNYQYFGTVSRSTYSLFSIITLSEFSVILRPLWEKQPVAVLFLITFTCCSAFGIMNVVIGLLVQQALEVSTTLLKAREEEHQIEQAKKVHVIKSVLHAMDEDGDDQISREELLNGIVENKMLTDLLMQITLPPNITIDEVFTLIDASGDGCVTPDEFASQLLRLMDCTQFQQMCLMQISMHEIKQILTMLHEKERAKEKEPDPIMNALTGIKEEISKLRVELMFKIESALVNPGNQSKHCNTAARSHSADAAISRTDKIEVQGWEALPSSVGALRLEAGNSQQFLKDKLVATPLANELLQLPKGESTGSPGVRQKLNLDERSVASNEMRPVGVRNELNYGGSTLLSIPSKGNGLFKGDDSPLKTQRGDNVSTCDALEGRLQ